MGNVKIIAALRAILINKFQFIGEKKVNQSRLYCSISGNKRMSLDKQSYHVIVHLTIN